MGSKPKKQEYQATAAEKASASVAKANYDFFKQNYAPLLREMRDQYNKKKLDSIINLFCRIILI